MGPTRGRAKPVLGRRFDRALVFAMKLHRDHKRKGTTIPYSSHLLGVTSLVIEVAPDEDLAIAALLHDGPEDCGGLPVLREIRRRFGNRVARIVDGCTEPLGSPKPPWRKRKEHYIEHLALAGDDVKFIAGADKLHNARSMVDTIRREGRRGWKRFNAGPTEQLWFYRSVIKALRRGKKRPFVRELTREVAELERLIKGSS
jgi:(p)ppGpp synthase/HD superfamily hydrolase